MFNNKGNCYIPKKNGKEIIFIIFNLYYRLLFTMYKYNGFLNIYILIYISNQMRLLIIVVTFIAIYIRSNYKYIRKIYKYVYIYNKINIYL